MPEATAGCTGPRLGVPGRKGMRRQRQGVAFQRCRGVLLVPLLAMLVLSAGCNYTFRAGAGLPSHVRTIAVLPLENESDRFDLAQQIHEAIQQDVPRAFGVRIASEENADAIIRGTVRRYAVDAGSYRSAPGGGAEVLERAVTLTLEIQVIDQRERMILWENRSLTARGQFQEGQELEEDGRALAIEQIVRDIINGLQSNW